MKLGRTLTKLQATAITVVSGVAGGAWALFTGMLDPSWLVAHTGSWFGISSLATRFVGPELVPSLPWSAITMVLALTFIGASLYRLDKNDELSNP